jgi:hypothetical protein
MILETPPREQSVRRDSHSWQFSCYSFAILHTSYLCCLWTQNFLQICPEVDVQCPHKRRGCSFCVRRAHLAAHVDLCPFEKLRSVLDGLEAQITDLRGKFLEKEAPGECSTPERNAKRKVRNDEPGQRSKNRKVDMGTCRAEVQEEKERGRDAADGARDIGRSAIQSANGEDMPEAPPEEVISGPFFSCYSNKAHSNRLDFTIIKTLEMV